MLFRVHKITNTHPQIMCIYCKLHIAFLVKLNVIILITEKYVEVLLSKSEIHYNLFLSANTVYIKYLGNYYKMFYN